MQNPTRLRIGSFLSVVTAVVLLGAWVLAGDHSLQGSLLVSLPILFLAYVAASTWNRARHFTLTPEGGEPTVSKEQNRLSQSLILVGISWLVVVSSLLFIMGDYRLGLFSVGVAAVFLAGLWPAPLTSKRIVAVFVGLVVASVTFLF